MLTRFFLLLALLLAAFPAPAQAPASTREAPTQGKTLRVATRAISPFAIKDGDRWRGFSIELWRQIGDEMGVETVFVERPNVRSLLSAVQSGKADVGIAAISITSQRERNLDFSLPMFDAGLQILVRGDSGAPSIWRVLSSPSLLPLLALLPLLILIPAHLIWLIERNHKDGLIENKGYLPGIGKAIWWAAGTVGAQADEMPKSPLGRFLAIAMMFAGVVFVAFFTAALTSALTVSQLRGDIQGPDDLPGKRVATVAGSTAADYLRENRARLSEFATIEQACAALDRDEVQAVVFDAPVLMYYAANAGQGKAHVVGPIFRREDYGIAVRSGSALRKPINTALLRLRESGDYQDLYDKWFHQQS